MKAELLDKVRKECLLCQNCDLYKTRNNIVFSDGNPDRAKAILIGEAPGETEDLTGKPFVGRAGKLLNEFLKETNISREDDLYIINTVKCRPPENRVPTTREKAACRKYIEEQIDIVNPEIIILCGATALKSFYKTPLSITKIRGEIIKIEVKDKIYKGITIFHPSYLLRNHSTDVGKPRWLMREDLKKIKEIIWG